MAVILSINFNNANSYYDKNLIIEGTPIVPTSQRNIIFTEIEGRNGSLTEDLGTYKDISIPVSFTLVDMANLKQSLRQIKAWLIGDLTDNKLIFSDDPNYFYKVKSCSIGDIENTVRVLGRFTATFVCEPFLYAIDDKKEIILGNTVTRAGLSSDPLQRYNFTSGTVYVNNQAVKSNLNGPVTFNNPGTKKSKPVIVIYGSGDIVISLNSTTFAISGLSEYVTIDSVMQDAYKGTLLQTNSMSGLFPELNPSDNYIAWSGNVERIEIQCNSTWL
ncbi:distal tail protein Dit [Rhodopseudomonas parapalustris]